MKKVIPLLMITILLFVFTSCENKALDYYKVTFDSDGGNYTPEEQYVKKGDKVIEPKSPDKGSTRGFMWWVDKDGTPYDFSKAVTSSFTLKAVYWPSNVLSSSKDSSTYDEKINEIYHETKCLYNIISSFISLEKLMSGNNDIASIFAVEDGKDAGDTIRAIVANAKMDENHIKIQGEEVKLENTGTIIHLSEDKYKTIESNKSETKDYGETGITRKKYIIDITNLALSTTFNIDYSSKSEIINTTISLKGTVIKYDGDRMEMHVQFTIDGKEYPVLHASTFDTTGGSEEITVSYKGYNGYFFIKDL